MWIVVAREEECAAPGDYRVVTIGTQSLLPKELFWPHAGPFPMRPDAAAA